VLNAVSTLVAARSNYATSRYNYINSLIALQYAAGTLTGAQVSTINAWLTRLTRLSPANMTPESMTPPAPKD
jgi:hypothetical protein